MNGATTIEPHPAQMSSDDLQKWVIRRLQDCRGPFFLGGDRADERPEDILVEMLNDKTLPKERRDAILRGLKTFGARINETLGVEQDSNLQGLQRWANVIDRAAPEELEAIVKAALTCAIYEDSAKREDVTALVRASLRYQTRAEDTALWRALLQREETCAFAFTALLKIQGTSYPLANDLLELWKRRIENGWRVNTDLLTASFLRQDKGGIFSTVFARRGSMGPIGEAMKHSRIDRVRQFADSNSIISPTYTTSRQAAHGGNTLDQYLYNFEGDYFSEEGSYSESVNRSWWPVISFPKGDHRQSRYSQPENPAAA